MSEYDEVRDNLLEMLEELSGRLDKITEDVKHANEPLSQDFSEQAVETENDEVLDFLGNATRAEMVKVRHAIDRIDGGVYGYCESCGEEINKERLKIIPFATLCIKCAEKSESR